MSDNVTKLNVTKGEKKVGSVVRLASGSPAMTISSIREMATCTHYDVEKGIFQDYEFYVEELELDSKKIDQSKF